MTLISLISLLGVKSLSSDRQAIAYGFLIVVAVVSIYWVILGIKIKQNLNNLNVVSGSIKIAMTIAFMIFAATLIKMIIQPGGGGGAGILSLVLGIYLLFAQSGIKKASNI